MPSSPSQPQSRQELDRSVLDSGLTVLTEHVPTVRSATIGVWLREGSRHEPADKHGIAHFLEHVLFKGTESRTSREIAVEIDRMGGALDAFTSREYACYFAQALDTHAGRAMDLLADITRNPVFPSEEIERERNVIFEEIKMVEDSPDDLAYDLLYEALWPDHPLGRPIQGVRESVEAISREDIEAFFRARYVPANLIVAAAGNILHDDLLEMVRERFGSLEERPVHDGDGPPDPCTATVVRPKAEMEQAHVILGFPGFSVQDERRYALGVLNALLGGGMSSRLFQAVREERGLAYSVYSAVGGYRDTGNVTVYAGTSRETLEEAVQVIGEELAKIKEHEVEAGELDNAREHLKGSLTLGLEPTSNRMSNLARQEIYYGRHFTLDEVLDKIDEVTVADVKEAARAIFQAGTACMTLVGNVEGADLSAEGLEF